MATQPITKRQLKHKDTYKSKKSFKLSEVLIPEFQSTILYIEGNINYSIIHFSSGKSIRSAYSLCIYESILSQHNFYRIHKKYLINETHVITVGAENITLTNQIRLNPSRRKQYTKKPQGK